MIESSFVKIDAATILEVLDLIDKKLKEASDKEWRIWYAEYSEWFYKSRFLSIFFKKKSFEEYKSHTVKNMHFTPNDTYYRSLGLRSDLMHAASAAIKSGDGYVYLSADDVYSLDCMSDHYFLN